MIRRWLWPALATVGGLVSFAGLARLIRSVLTSSGGSAAAGAAEWGLWSALVAASAVVFAFLFAYSIPQATGWRRHVGVAGWQPLVVYTGIAGALLFFLWGNPNPIAKLHPSPVLLVSRTLVLLGLITAAPAVLGLWLVHARMRRISDLFDRRTEESRQAVDVLADLIECRRQQSTCLTVLAIIVTTAVIDAGAQRKAFLATGTRPEQFPAEAVLLYGALFTAISLLLYVPTFIAWRARCLQFVDKVYPLPKDARPTEDWVYGRTRLTQVLGADASIAKNLTAAFGILAPLATSVLSVVVPGIE
ncbi:MAG: hypothetical protein M3O70_18900 [Actinomycetota bacterium]|nr:hypothetical protein [Actinomycetota bacterium]